MSVITDEMSFKCSSSKIKMASNWHLQLVALVSGVVVINRTIRRRTESLLLDLAYACCNHLLFEVSRRRTGMLLMKASFWVYYASKMLRCSDRCKKTKHLYCSWSPSSYHFIHWRKKKQTNKKNCKYHNVLVLSEDISWYRVVYQGTQCWLLFMECSGFTSTWVVAS